MTQTITITKDAHVDQSSPNTNYGTNTLLPCYNTGTNINYALLDLPWTSITNTQDVVKIELKLRVLSNNNDSDISVTRLLSTWDESTVTYNNAPSDSVYGLYYEDSITNNIAHTYTIDLTSFIGMLNSGLYTDYGIAIHKTDIDATPISFASSEYAITAYRPYLEITELGDIGYEYQVFSTIIDTWYTVWHPTMTSIVDNVDTNQTTYEIEVQIQAPWESSVSTYYLDVGEQQMFSDVQAGYTDYFVVENYSTSFSGEIGYYPVIAVAYYREYNDRYVKTDGDDDDTGRTWVNAFASIEKGFEATPDGGNLYVESGVYSETLDNLHLASGNTEINIVPMSAGHVSTDYASAVIGTGTVTEYGNAQSAAYTTNGQSAYTFMDTTLSAQSNYILQAVSHTLYSSGDATVNVQFSQIRESGSNYILIDQSDTMALSLSTTSYIYTFDMCFEMVTGDMIAITIERTSGTGIYWYIGTIYDAGNGAYRLKSGYLTGDTAISSWNTNDNVLLQMKYIYFA